MKPYFGIPDIHDSLARDNYPSDLENFETRIAQAIVRNKTDRVFSSESQEQNYKHLEELYRELGVSELIIGKDQRVSVSRNKGEFLADTVLREVPQTELQELLGGYQLTPYNCSNSSDEVSKVANADILRTNFASSIINNKSVAQSELRMLGVLTPDGKQVFNEKEALDFYKELSKSGYKRVSFKLNNSLNGMGVFTANNKGEFEKLLERFSDHLAGGILIDGWLEGKIASPNIQYFVGKQQSEDRLIGCSDQILVDGGTEHIGNISDVYFLSNPRLQSDIQKILNWVRSKKGYGVIGIDFLINEDGAYFIEINGRYNGSTHGPVISDKLGITNWGTHDGVLVPEKSLNEFVGRLERDKLLYRDGKGIIPVNPGTLHLGKTMVLALADTKREIEGLIYNVTH